MMEERYLGNAGNLKVLRGQPFFHESGRGEVSRYVLEFFPMYLVTFFPFFHSSNKTTVCGLFSTS
jgi:hypothetical protein